jgi:hypothetical protein
MEDEFGEVNSNAAHVAGSGGISSSLQSGHSSMNENSEIDSEKYFRMVAKEIHENYSKPTGWPVILASLPEHHNLFHKVNKNPWLLEESISLNPDAGSIEKLGNLAWELMEPAFVRKTESLIERFEQARANGKGGTDLKELAVAIVGGKVDTLIIEADKIIASRITNLVTGNIQNKAIENPKMDDLLDDMGELVVKMGGTVIVMSADKIPSETGAAAIYRY